MNDIFSNYLEIPEAELNKRIAFYEGLEFLDEAIWLMIPDVVGYVVKIFDCLRWAEQSRKIIEDISEKIVEARVIQSKIVTSVSYNVGSLKFNGRTYLQQNIHHYCQYIAEINDCMMQILNIVYNVGFRQWDSIQAECILKSSELNTHTNVVQQLKKFHNIIAPHKEINNYVKHNLVLWGHEKLTPYCIENIEFYFNMYSKEYKVSEIISATNEHQIKSLVVELLDNVFHRVSIDTYEARKYVSLNFDYFDDKCQPTDENKTIPLDKFITLRVETKLEGRYYKTKSITFHCNDASACIELYLARLEQSLLEDGVIQTSLDILDVNEFDVYQNGELIGKYRCKERKDRDAKFFHFKKYNFIKL